MKKPVDLNDFSSDSFNPFDNSQDGICNECKIEVGLCECEDIVNCDNCQDGFGRQHRCPTKTKCEHCGEPYNEDGEPTCQCDDLPNDD